METCLIFDNPKLIDYARLKWTLKALSREVSRYQLNKLFSEDGEIVAMDGHRLHIAKLDEPIPNGTYRVVIAGKVIVLILSIGEYHDYKKVFPSGSFKELSLECSHWPSRISTMLCQFLRLVDESEGINLKYFTELISDGSWSVKYYGKATGVLFESTDNTFRRGLIMPMRM